MTENDTRGGVGRRDLLKATCAAGVATAASSAAGRVRAQDGDFGEWFEGVDNYDGVQDRTGNDQVTVTVGVEANGGNYGFGPAAVRVDPGTEVVWEWRAGSHNVVHQDGDFESELTDEEGFTFTQTFDEDGVYLYYCTPHRDLGMRGAVVVGDVEVDEEAAAESGQEGGNESEGSGGDTEDGHEGGGSGGGVANSTDAMLIGVSMLAAFLSPIAFALFLFARGGESETEPPAPR